MFLIINPLNVENVRWNLLIEIETDKVSNISWRNKMFKKNHIELHFSNLKLCFSIIKMTKFVNPKYRILKLFEPA